MGMAKPLTEDQAERQQNRMIDFVSDRFARHRRLKGKRYNEARDKFRREMREALDYGQFKTKGT